MLYKFTMEATTDLSDTPSNFKQLASRSDVLREGDKQRFRRTGEFNIYAEEINVMDISTRFTSYL